MANQTRHLLSGNESIAKGAYDAGATVGTGYPGTPSTETLEAFAGFDGVYAEWSVNEKVALEVALGASCAGSRTLTTMKHVGVNVAADPLFTAAYTGVGGGMVILAADDPGMHSSQNEQDSHYYGLAAHIPVLDPADSQEAYSFTRHAYEVSEEFDVPVMIRSTVRISHSRTPVVFDEKDVFEKPRYEKHPEKWVMMPLYAKGRRIEQISRIERLKQFSDESELNRQELRDRSMGIVCSGAVYQYVREALPEASTLKLGITYPLPEKKLKEFRDAVQDLYVIEEASDYLRDGVSALGIDVSDTPFPIKEAGELSQGAIREAFGIEALPHDKAIEDIPARPPALCAGCPHRVVFKELSRLKAIVTGDIGCYTLGALPPLSAIDSVVDMGASVSMAHGMEIAKDADDARPVVGIIGDSTFAHSGLSSLMSTVYNAGTGTVVILDNRTTAMTGRQGNPFNGVGLQNRTTNELDLEMVVRGLGVEDVSVIDPNDVEQTRAALKAATTSTERLSVIIFKRPCVLLERRRETPYFIANCTGCGVCLTLGCPAIGKDQDTGLSYIDTDACIGCGQCAQYCRFKAIVR